VSFHPRRFGQNLHSQCCFVDGFGFLGEKINTDVLFHELSTEGLFQLWNQSFPNDIQPPELAPTPGTFEAALAAIFEYTCVSIVVTPARLLSVALRVTSDG